jgi:hypothetical protein
MKETTPSYHTLIKERRKYARWERKIHHTWAPEGKF